MRNWITSRIAETLLPHHQEGKRKKWAQESPGPATLEMIMRAGNDPGPRN
jgi:hypothetical protein